MTIFIIASTIAAILQVGTIYFLRSNFLGSFLYAIPFILAYQFLFLWSYSHAPKFIVIWFITTALTNCLAFILGYFLWHEQVALIQVIGMVLIIVGIIFLQLK